MKKARTVEEYLAKVKEPARSTLERVREGIRAAAPREATERISWGMPAFYHGRTLVCYAAFQKHCSFFPMSGAVIEQLAPELARYECTKGTIHCRLAKPLPAALIKRLVKARLAEMDSA